MKMAMAAMVCRAFLTAGSLNTGTALLMASTPVRAVAPAAKVRSSRKMVTGASVRGTRPGPFSATGTISGKTPGPCVRATPMPKRIRPM